MLKVTSLSLDALTKSGYTSVHRSSSLVHMNLTNFVVDGVHELLSVWEQFTSHLPLQNGEQPAIWRVEIWAVCQMWNLWNPDLLEPSLHRIGLVGRDAIIKDSSAACPPNLRSAPVDGVPEFLKHLEVQGSIHSLSLRHKSLVDQSKTVKKTWSTSPLELTARGQEPLG